MGYTSLSYREGYLSVPSFWEVGFQERVDPRACRRLAARLGLLGNHRWGEGEEGERRREGAQPGVAAAAAAAAIPRLVRCAGQRARARPSPELGPPNLTRGPAGVRRGGRRGGL